MVASLHVLNGFEATVSRTFTSCASRAASPLCSSCRLVNMAPPPLADWRSVLSKPGCKRCWSDFEVPLWDEYELYSDMSYLESPPAISHCSHCPEPHRFAQLPSKLICLRPRVRYFRNERAYSVESSLLGISSNSLLWNQNKWLVVQPIAFGVTIGRSPNSFSDHVFQSRIVSNIHFLTFSILHVDLISPQYEVLV